MLNSELIYNSFQYKGYTVNWCYDQEPENPRDLSNVSEINSWNERNSYADYNFPDRESAIVDLLYSYSSVEKIGQFLIDGKGDASFKVLFDETDLVTVGIFNGRENESIKVDRIPEGTETDYWNSFCEDYEDSLLDIVAQMISSYDLREILKDSVNVYGLEVSNYGVNLELNNNPMYYSGISNLVFVTKDKALKEFGNVNESNWYERAEKCISDEMNDFNSYVIGEVYGYQILNQSGIEIDSCWGYIGEEGMKECSKDIESFIDAEVKKDEEFKVRNSKVLNLVDKIKNVLAPEGYSLELVKLS